MPLNRHNAVPSHHYDEGAQKLWSIYVDEGDQHDTVLTETWKVDLDSTLIFAGLFSATITAFIIESYKLMKPDSSDTTNALLAQILAILASSNSSSVSFPTSIDSQFSAPAWAIGVNVLWFLSLASVLTAALVVTLVQQWVRDYLHRINHYTQPLKCARMRLFLFDGIEKWKLDDIVEYIPTLLHASLFLFFTGLCVFLVNINKVVLGFVGFVFGCCMIAYGIATIAPFFDPSTPFETPLSSIISHVSSAMGCRRRREKLLTLSGLREQRAVEPFEPHKGDAHAISWVIQRSTDDGECEALLSCVPGFLGSDDGQKTWREILLCPPEIIETFIERAANLLATATPLYGGHMSDQDMKRVSVCLDALFAFLRTTPRSFPPQINISPLSKSLSQFVSATHKDISPQAQDVSLRAKAICILALHKHLIVPPGLEEMESQVVHARIMKLRRLSLEADSALQQLDSMRQKLEDITEGFYRQGGTDTTRVSNTLNSYLGTINDSSKTFAAWLSCPGTVDGNVTIVLGAWSEYLIQFGESDQQIPKVQDRLRLTYHNIPHLYDETWSVFALLIMSYMRHTQVYPSLDVLPSPPSKSLESWFPFLNMLDGRWILCEKFVRELSPLASALDILLPHTNPMPYVKDRSVYSQFDLRKMFGFSVEVALPSLPALGCPFSLWASIAHATAYGCETRALFDLVSAFRDSTQPGGQGIPASNFSEPVIGKALAIVDEQFRIKGSTGSLLFTLSILCQILRLEREGSLFPFSQGNIDFIVNVIFRNILRREHLICLQESPDVIGTLGEGFEGSEKGLLSEELQGAGMQTLSGRTPLYDLRELYEGETTDGSQLTWWLEESNYLSVDNEEKSNICLRIMQARYHSKARFQVLQQAVSLE
ncbi:hypothetical protein DXG01_014884 [Tephrocybe rancida]|nr:hypothetical protein DXG01_014884 [Tephrocybe rancida]